MLLEEQFRTIARLQQHLLPREVPRPAGWHIAVHYNTGTHVLTSLDEFLVWREPQDDVTLLVLERER